MLDPAAMRAPACVVCLLLPFVAAASVPPWRGQTVQDLHREYYTIFRHGNRNAASHLWSAFLLDRSDQMDADKLAYMFSGYCAVSGSPVNPSDFNRYLLKLPLVGGGERVGYMHYCCWPCVCDTQDFLRVDTKNVTLLGGRERQFHFAVLGNPCDDPMQLDIPFSNFGREYTTLRAAAPEVRCGPEGELLGATLSDNGYPIIAMFFDAQQDDPSNDIPVGFVPQPGRIMRSSDGTRFNHEAEFGPMCEEREMHNFNSGMGEIFRRVAEISPVQCPTLGIEELSASQEDQTASNEENASLSVERAGEVTAKKAQPCETDNPAECIDSGDI